MKLAGQLKGKAEFKKKIAAIKAESPGYGAETVLEIALLVHGRAVRALQKKSHGYQQFRYRSASRNAASRWVWVAAPGEAPNTDSGASVASIELQADTTKMMAAVGTNKKSLAALEFGVPSKNISPHPWLRPALEAFKKSDAGTFFSTTAPKFFRKHLRGIL